jgi:hypothetical protein
MTGQVAEGVSDHAVGDLGDRHAVRVRPARGLRLDHVPDDLAEHTARIEQLVDELVEGVGRRGGRSVSVHVDARFRRRR